MLKRRKIFLLILFFDLSANGAARLLFRNFIDDVARDFDVELVSIIDSARFDLGQVDVVGVEVDVGKVPNLDLHVLHRRSRVLVCRLSLGC